LTIRKIRISSQILFLLFFLYLFWKTSEVSGRWIPVDLYLRADPLLALLGMIAARVLIPSMLASIAVIAATIILGRVFCGWVCPMGTTLDLVSRIGRTVNRFKLRQFQHLKYYLLSGFFLSAVLGYQLVYNLDPIALTTRIFTVALLPIVVTTFNYIFNLLFQIEPLQFQLLGLQSSLIDSLLPLEPYYFQTAFILGLIFAVIIGFELYSRRVVCQVVCPLGAMLGLMGMPQRLKRKVNQDCTECGECQLVCKTNAIPEDFSQTEFRECIQCFNCVDVCAPGATIINFRGEAKSCVTDFTRRKLLLSGVGGIAAASLTGISYIRPEQASKLIRPPGSTPEAEFVERCVRCYQCLRACATSGNFLQPSLLEGGWAGLLTPYGVAGTGYCEYNCTLCTEVCPSGAIHPLNVEAKHKTVIGLAYFDKNRCLPYANGTPCIVCEEHCPTPKKAIEFKQEEYQYRDGSKKMIKFPFIVEELCIGCGICEFKCPVEGARGVCITNKNQQRFRPGGQFGKDNKDYGNE